MTKLHAYRASPAAPIWIKHCSIEHASSMDRAIVRSPCLIRT